VIDGGAAESLDDAFLIEFECEGACVDTDRDWALDQSGGKFDRVVSFDFLEISQFHITCLFLLGTLFILGKIRILSFRLQRNMFGIVVTILDEASATSVVSIRN